MSLISKDAKGAKDGQLQEDVVGPKAVLATIIKRVKPRKTESQPIKETELGDDSILKLISENPQMSASTFYNLLKSKGAKIVGISQVEADSGSSIAQVLRAEVKESKGMQSISFKFLESVSGEVKGVDGTPENNIVGFTKFKVVLLEEGMGNLKDAYFYSKDALASAVPVFEGTKIYADHPSKMDEQIRPERSVRDILGHFENVHLEEGEAGQALLVGEVNILPDDSFRWARSLMEQAVSFSKKYPDKELIGLSINADGDAEQMPIDELLKMQVPESALVKINKAKEAGVAEVRVVKQITSAVSCDLVTEAGAKGRVLQMLESKSGDTMDKKKELEEGGPGSGRRAGGGSGSSKLDAARARNQAKLAKSLKDQASFNRKSRLIKAGQAKANANATMQKSIDQTRQIKKSLEGDKTLENENLLKGDLMDTKDMKDQKDPSHLEGTAIPEHDDAAQDAELIKSMIKKYMGDDAEASDEELGVVKEAYEVCKEMGCNEDEAGEKAVHHLKMMKHMASKEAELKSTEKEDEVKESETKESEKVEEAKKEGDDKHKESMIKLQAENAKLRESLAKVEIEKTIETLCAKSGHSRIITKSFREAIGTPKSVDEVNKAWKLFEAGLKGLPMTESNFDFALPEKQTIAAGEKFSFDDINK